MLFHAAHYNQMAGHLGRIDKALNILMADFYRLDICGGVHRRFATCCECQLINLQKVPFHPLQYHYLQTPLKKIGIHLIGRLGKVTNKYCFVLFLVGFAACRSSASTHISTTLGLEENQRLTDQCTAFMSQTLCKLLGIKLIYISIYCP